MLVFAAGSSHLFSAAVGFPRKTSLFLAILALPLLAHLLDKVDITAFPRALIIDQRMQVCAARLAAFFDEAGVLRTLPPPSFCVGIAPAAFTPVKLISIFYICCVLSIQFPRLAPFPLSLTFLVEGMGEPFARRHPNMFGRVA